MAAANVTVICGIDNCETKFNVTPRRVKGVLAQHRKLVHPDWKAPTGKPPMDPYRLDYWR